MLSLTLTSGLLGNPVGCTFRIDAEFKPFLPSTLVHFLKLPPSSHQDHLSSFLKGHTMSMLISPAAISQKCEQMGFIQSIRLGPFSAQKSPMAPSHSGQKPKANILAVVCQGLDDLALWHLLWLSSWLPCLSLWWTVPSLVWPSPSVRNQMLGPLRPAMCPLMFFLAQLCSFSLTWKYFYLICSS